MAARLSRLAKYHIADFVNHREVIVLPREWHEMYEIYHSGGIQLRRMPLPEYAMTKDFDLCIRKDVSPTAVEYLFAEGPAATFWYNVPTGLISRIVESFLQRPTETALRPIFCVFDSSRAEFSKKSMLRRVKIYDGGCTNHFPIPLQRSAPHRRQLLAEVLLEAYRFLDRYSLDVSQLVCDEWRGSIERSSDRVALYALAARFTHIECMRLPESMRGQFSSAMRDHEWEAAFANYADCFGEVNARNFHFLNAQPPEHSSAVIRRHLRNAFVKRMSCSVMQGFDWCLGMLLGLSDSTLVETLDVYFIREECLTLLGRFEEALIRRKVQKLNLTVMGPLLKALVDHHNFFGRPSIQQLRKLDLRIQHQALPEPHWLPALYEPSGCPHVAVHYPRKPHGHDTVDVTRISTALHATLEDFETTGRYITVDHFSLISYVHIPSLVVNRKPAFERIPVPRISTADSRRWNVYYYETVDTKKCLTLFVALDDLHWTRSRVHIKRGKITDFT